MTTKTLTLPALYTRGKQYRADCQGCSGYYATITTQNQQDRDSFAIDGGGTSPDWYVHDVDHHPTKRLIALAAKGWTFWMHEGDHYAQSPSGEIYGYNFKPLTWRRGEYEYLDALDSWRNTARKS
jgi:hypothetical protein